MTNTEKNNLKLQGKVNETNYNYINSEMSGTFNDKINLLVELHKNYEERNAQNKLVVSDKIEQMQGLAERIINIAGAIANEANTFVDDYLEQGKSKIDQYSEINVNFEEFKTKYNMLLEEHDKQKEELTKLQIDNDLKRSDIAELNEKVNELSKKNTELLSDKSIAEMQQIKITEDKNEEIKRLNEQISKLQSEKNGLEIDLSEARNKLVVKQQEITSRLDQIKDLNKNIADLREDKSELRSDLVKANASIIELSKLSDVNIRLKSEIDSLESRNKVQESQIKRLEKTIERLEAENKGLKNTK